MTETADLSGTHSRLLAALGALLALALAAALRLPSPGNGLPQTLDPDSVIVGQAVAMEEIRETGEEKRVSELYPFLLALVIELFPGEVAAHAPRGSSLEEHLAAAARPHVVVRLWIAALGCLAVPAVWLLARRFLEPTWATLAAVLMATSLLHLLLSRQARPHAALTACVAWALFTAVWMARRGSPWSILACGTATALAVGVLHSGAAVLPAVALACLFVLRDQGGGAIPRLAPIPLLLVIAVGVSYPFLFEGSDVWAERKWPESVFTGEGFARVPLTLLSFEPVLLALSTAGLVALLRGARGAPWRTERGRGACILAAFAIPYFVAIGMYHSTWHRFSLPLVPVLAVLAALGGRSIWRAAARRARFLDGPRGAVLAAAALAAFPTATAARFASLYSRPHSSDLAARWVEEHLDPRKDVVAVSYKMNLPVAQSLKSVRRTTRFLRSPWERYVHEVGGLELGREWHLYTLHLRENVRADPSRITAGEMERRLRTLRATYAVVVVPRGDRHDFDGARRAMKEMDATLMKVIEPHTSDVLSGTMGGHDQLGYEALRVAWAANGLGPKLEIYRLPKRKPVAGR